MIFAMNKASSPVGRSKRVLIVWYRAAYTALLCGQGLNVLESLTLRLSATVIYLKKYNNYITYTLLYIQY